MVFNTIGSLLEDSHDLESALNYYNRALAILEKESRSSLSAATVINNIGSIYFDQKKYQKALEYYNRSFRIEFHDAPDSLPHLVRNIFQHCICESSPK